MAKIKGTWLLNSTLSSSANGLSQVVDFTSNNIAFDIMLLLGDYQSSMTYGNIESTYSVYTHSGGWKNPSFRVVDFGSFDQEVSDEWYAAFIKNARQASTEEDDEESEEWDEILVIKKSTLDGIADAVREKTGKTAQMLGSEITGEIKNIPPRPIEVSTEANMTALLATAEIGSIYKYVGTAGTYENGALYIVEGSE